jgi:hypothetical protein
MPNPNDGGPAFPASGGKEGTPNHYPLGTTGMSLRDYFAAAALAGIAEGGIEQDYEPSHIAVIAYRLADAMLAEREKNHEPSSYRCN